MPWDILHKSKPILLFSDGLMLFDTKCSRRYAIIGGQLWNKDFLIWFYSNSNSIVIGPLMILSKWSEWLFNLNESFPHLFIRHSIGSFLFDRSKGHGSDCTAALSGNAPLSLSCVLYNNAHLPVQWQCTKPAPASTTKGKCAGNTNNILIGGEFFRQRAKNPHINYIYLMLAWCWG